MKKIITIIAIFILQQICYTQGNLQFDHAFFEQLESFGGTDPTLNIVVPTGQVFKMTHASVGGNSGVRLEVKKSTNTTYSTLSRSEMPPHSSFPIWFEPGTYTFKLDNASGQSYGATISGIFFNVIP